MEQCSLLSMVRLRGITGRGANAAVLFADQFFRRESLIRSIRPEFAAHALVQAFREGFRQAVRQRAQQNSAVIILRGLETLDVLLLADPRGDREAADVVGDA